MKNLIIPTSTAEHLVKKIEVKTKDFKVIFPEKNKEGKRCFPDEKIYMKIPKVKKLKNETILSN